MASFGVSFTYVFCYCRKEEDIKDSLDIFYNDAFFTKIYTV